MSAEKKYDVIIIGGGASGAALLYTLARYTNLPRVALVEKYDSLGSVNSSAVNNSQTLHVGEIETNYTLDKVRQVQPAALMVKRYVDALPPEEGVAIMRRVQKMVLAVGSMEVTQLEQRFPPLQEIFPELQKLDAAGIAQVEPELMRGRDPREPVLALYTPEGYAVNFGLLAQSLGHEAQKSERVDLLLGHRVERIEKREAGYTLHTNRGPLYAKAVVVDADAYSLGFAKSLGYGKEFSLIPVAGSFYFTPEKLRGKVYRVQAPRMPFSAVHGDPDLTRPGATRWGPTARFYPVLEAGKLSTMWSFFTSSGFERLATWVSFVSILLEPIRFWYLIKNFFYDLPIIGKYIFIPQIRKIVPTLRVADLEWAKGYGGMRLQRVDTTTREILLGEGKIVGDNIIFNMTPSPGASVCLYNAMRDAEQVVKFLPHSTFDKARMERDLCITQAPLPDVDVSLKDSYPS